MSTEQTGEAAEQKTVVGPGSVIAGKYRIERLIGRGGMGVVFEARHVSIGRTVAIKLLQARLAGEERHLARFQREARIYGTLDHENIAAIHDIGKIADGRPYLVMEFVRGFTLRVALQDQGPFPIPRAVGLIRQACRGLSAAHQRGVIHRDIKPENLLVTRRADGRDLLKIVDFGIARLLERSEDAPTTTAPIGTPHYIAPESLSDQVLDERADVYALGVILFELLSGTRPYRGSSVHAVMYNIAHSEIANLRKLRPQVTPGLQKVIEQALHKEKEGRIRNCQTLLHALEPFEAPRVESVSSSWTTESEGEASFRMPRRRSRRARVALAAIPALAVSVLAATYFVRPRLDTRRESAVPSTVQELPSAPESGTVVPRSNLVVPVEHQHVNDPPVLAEASASALTRLTKRSPPPASAWTPAPKTTPAREPHEHHKRTPGHEALPMLDRENPYD